ncbi:MAG: hypothetical protein DRI90_25925 [Deltaproteobacteria bacterium]|nr:MAG: hypothetical protein DRI90_25925 [Deltaproteobacteria bacterium]
MAPPPEPTTGAGRLVVLLTLLSLLAAVLAMGCGSTSQRQPPPPRPLPPNVRKMPDGSCWYYPPSNCPPPHLTTCDAEVARRIQCPY